MGVPQGTMENPAETGTTSFNYYIDQETLELVFFNYEPIKAGSNSAFPGVI